jgi:hypothetical protein
MPKEPPSGDSPQPRLEWTRRLDQECGDSSTDAAGGCRALYVAPDGPAAAIRLLRRVVPRHGPRCREDRDLPGRRRLPHVPRPARPRRPQARLAPARVLPDDEPLPPRRGGDGRPAIRGVPQAQRPLRPGFQRTPRPVGPPVRGALLERPDRGRGRARPRLSLRRRESRAGRALCASGRLAVERLAPRVAT